MTSTRKRTRLRSLAVRGVAVVAFGLWVGVETASAQAIPTGVTATAGNGEVTLEWDDPDDSLITHYSYRISINSSWGSAIVMEGSGSETTQYVVTGLQNGALQQFHIRADYAGSSSAWSIPCL